MHSEIGPHQGEIRLSNGERIATIKQWGEWRAKGKWARAGSSSSLASLERRIETKAKASNAKPSKAGAGKVVTTWDPLVFLGLTTRPASTKSPTKPWWSNLDSGKPAKKWWQ